MLYLLYNWVWIYKNIEEIAPIKAFFFSISRMKIERNAGSFLFQLF